MADREISFLIKTIYDGKGSDLSRQDFRRLITEANNGSKEAADALDRWRAAYGRLSAAALQARGVVQGGNTGAGLATGTGMTPYPAATTPNATLTPAPASSGGPEEGIGGLGNLARRFGPAAIGLGIITRALHEGVSALKEYFAAVDRAVARALDFELIGTKVESLTSKTRQANIESKEFEQQYSRISENVKTVALEIAHLTELLESQLRVQARVADARMEQEMAANALRNRFNPIARIQEETRIREAALLRQMEQERAMDAMRQRIHESEARRAKEAEQTYRARAAASRENIKGLSIESDTQEERAKESEKESELKVAAMKEELALVDLIAKGEEGPFTKARLSLLRGRVDKSLSPDTEASEGAHSGWTEYGMKLSAVARAKELRSGIGDALRASQDARDNARNARSRLRMEERDLDFSEGKVSTLGTEAVSAQEKAAQEQAIINQKRAAQEEIIRLQKQELQDRNTLQIQQSLQPVSTRGGVSSLDPQMQKNNELLERMAVTIERAFA